MAINWLTALKVLPWGDMIEYAPRVVSGAHKLWQRAKAEQAGEDADAIDGEAVATDSGRELQELKEQLLELQTQQLEMSNLVSELAEQNQRLVGAVSILRTRTRLLGFVAVLLAAAAIYLFATR